MTRCGRRLPATSCEPPKDSASTRGLNDLPKTYFESFDPSIVALTGTPKALTAVAKSSPIFHRKEPTEGGGYTMGHTAPVVVTDAEGELVSVIDYHENAAPALSKLRRAIRKS
ncbi:SCO family protein [Microvirga sp. BT688]|uniref:SCO family protein n=1 Tax=Microvirga sp. TaxID=1873136 RepID=UPI0016834FD7|nr:SCO family protein [Microvirga sp.]MBD2750916.1 SCO family protein [Microvirga sp.]